MPDAIPILIILMAWVCVGNVIYFMIQWYLNNRHLGCQDCRPMKNVVVIESVKGADTEFSDHVSALMNQDHPCYRIIFCLSDTQDPAFLSLAALFNLAEDLVGPVYCIPKQRLEDLNIGGSGLLSVHITVAGNAQSCSQKVFNQLQAYELLLPGDDILAWVDADIHLNENWLNNLISPIGENKDAAVTGYRCLVPTGPGDWPSAVGSVINASILTLLGDPWRNSLWGGSMAMTRTIFEKLKISEYVKPCFTDDESVGALLKKNNVPIYFSYAVLPLGKIDYTWKELFNFGRRQYLCARLYYPFHMFIALLLLGGFTLIYFFFVIKILVQPSEFDIVLFIGLISAIVVRGILRFSFIRNGLGFPEYNLKCLFLETLGTPITHLIHLGLCFSAMIGHTVDWAGITYKIRGAFNVKVV